MRPGSLTTRGNESGEKVREHILGLHKHFKSNAGCKLAEEQLARLRAGDLFQTVVTEFPLPAEIQPKNFKHEEKNFKP